MFDEWLTQPVFSKKILLSLQGFFGSLEHGRMFRLLRFLQMFRLGLLVARATVWTRWSHLEDIFFSATSGNCIPSTVEVLKSTGEVTNLREELVVQASENRLEMLGMEPVVWTRCFSVWKFELSPHIFKVGCDAEWHRHDLSADFQRDWVLEYCTLSNAYQMLLRFPF